MQYDRISTTCKDVENETSWLHQAAASVSPPTPSQKTDCLTHKPMAHLGHLTQRLSLSPAVNGAMHLRLRSSAQPDAAQILPHGQWVLRCRSLHIAALMQAGIASMALPTSSCAPMRALEKNTWSSSLLPSMSGSVAVVCSCELHGIIGMMTASGWCAIT